MAWLEICGFGVDVAVGNSDEEHSDYGGDPVRDLNGKPVRPGMGMVRDDVLVTPQITRAKARALRQLCGSESGEVWHCNDSSYSTNGQGFTDSATFSTTETKFGSHSLAVANTDADFDVCDVGTEWTVGLWAHEGSSWKHYALDSDGTQYVDGVEDSGATLPFSVSSGTLTLSSPASGTTYFDDIVVLNLVIWSAWAADWPTDEAFADLPHSPVISGDVVAPYTHYAQIDTAVSNQDSVVGSTVEMSVMMGPRVATAAATLTVPDWVANNGWEWHADDLSGYSEGANITAWTDRHKGDDLVDRAVSPTYTADYSSTGYPAAEVTDSGSFTIDKVDMTGSGGSALPQPYTVITVWRDWSGGSFLSGTDDSGGRCEVYYSGGDLRVQTTAGSITGGGAFSSGVATCVANGASSELYNDRTGAGGGDLGSVALDGFTASGRYSSHSGGGALHWCAVVEYAPSASELSDLWDYLYQEFGLAAP
jgi:hypothetical protein